MTGEFYTAWARFDFAHKYGGQQSHSTNNALPYTICGRFPRYALGDYSASAHSEPPTCKKCRAEDPRFIEPEPIGERLLRLRTTGFRKLREGRIHVRCYTCGRKMSNTHREPHDPSNAVLLETACERCSMGGKDHEVNYYDAAGSFIEALDMYCVACGVYLDGGMVERPGEALRGDSGLCVECAEDGATDNAAASVVLAVDPAEQSVADSWSTPAPAVAIPAATPHVRKTK